MPKIPSNDKIDYFSLSGSVIKHDIWVDQGLKIVDSPTFSNLTITNDLNVEGGLIINTSNTSSILVKTNSSDVFNIDSMNYNTSISTGVQINTNSTSGFSVKNGNLNILSINNSSSTTRIYSTTESTDISVGGLIIDCGVSIGKNLNILGVSKFNSTINANNNIISNLHSPVEDQDAANKSYVDAIAQGVKIKDSVKVATIIAGTLATSFVNGATIDTYTLVTNDRILIKNQTNAVENGIYIVQVAGVPIRSADLDIGAAAAGSFVYVLNGSQEGVGIICNSLVGFDIVGTDNLNFTTYLGSNVTIAGEGLTKVLNTIDVNVDNSSIEIISDTLRIKNTICGTGLTGGSGSVLSVIANQSQITGLGTIASGGWQGSTIGVLYGGTGNGFFSLGNIIFGNNTNSLLTSSDLFFSSSKLGLGTISPTEKIHISNSYGSNILINSDNLGTQSTSSSSIMFASNSTIQSKIILTKTGGDATGSLVNSLLFKSNVNVQLATNSIVRMTITSVGNVGINNTAPNSTLDITGTLASTLITCENISISGGMISNVVSSGSLYTGLLEIEDNAPIIGVNNSNTINTRDVGINLQRFQKDNDLGLGDIINDTLVYTDTLPSQSGVLINQIKFSTSANSTINYYIGYWIKINSQVRKIIGYSGGTRLATLSSDLSTPAVITDVVNFYNNNYASINYNESSKLISLINITNKPNQTIANVNNYIDLKLEHLLVNNNSTAGINSLGGIYINNTSNASSSTQGGALTALGGGAFNKSVYIGENIGIGNITSINDSISIYKNNSTISLKHSVGNYSYINFVENSTLNNWGIILDSSTNLFSLTNSTSGNTPNNSNKFFNATSNGNIGINTTTNINSILTLKNSNFITTDSTAGFLGLSSSTNTIGSTIILYGNGNSAGNIKIRGGNSGTSGHLQFYTNDIENFRVDANGNYLHFLSTQNSSNCSTGALVIEGGVSINNTSNATSYTQGGNLTCSGGAAFNKDVYINGNVFINGSLTTPGVITTPTIGFSNTSGLSSLSYGNVKMQTISNEALLSFYVNVIPNVAAVDTKFDFGVPNRTSVWGQRFELNNSITGYTDETELIPLNNLLCVGVVGTTKGSIKFQSVDLNVHSFSVILKYTTS